MKTPVLVIAVGAGVFSGGLVMAGVMLAASGDAMGGGIGVALGCALLAMALRLVESHRPDRSSRFRKLRCYCLLPVSPLMLISGAGMILHRAEPLAGGLWMVSGAVYLIVTVKMVMDLYRAAAREEG